MENALASPTLTIPRPTQPRALVWTGRVLTGLITAFLMVDAIGKLIPLALYVEGTQKLGFDVAVVRPLGLVLAVSTLLHLVSRTQLIGAALLTAYLGGAVATQVHAGAPFWFPVTMGALLWIAYTLRSSQLRALLLSSVR